MRRRTALAILAAGSLAAARRAAQAQEGPIRIGCLCPLTGPSAELGMALRAGAEITAELVNQAGGVLGRPIELLFRDDQGSANGAVAAYRELVSAGIRLFTGLTTSTTALAVVPLLPADQAVAAVSVTAAMSLSHEAFVPNFFRLSPNAYAPCRTTARLMAQHYPAITNWGFILPDNAAGRDEHAAFVSGFNDYYPRIAGHPANLSPPIWAKPDATDFKVQLTALMNSPVEGLVVGMVGGASITLYGQGRAFGWEKRVKVFNDVGQELILGQGLGRNIPENLWSFSRWYFAAHDGNAVSAALRAAYAARFGARLIPGFVGIGQESVASLVAGLRQAGTTDIPAVIAAMAGLTFETASGPITLRAQDHQALRNLDFIRMGPTQSEPGWGVLETQTISIAEDMEPASPGVAFKY